MTNNLQQTLTDKLKAKMIEDRKALEQLTETQLKMFKQNIQKQFNDANASIDVNMAELKRKVVPEPTRTLDISPRIQPVAHPLPGDRHILDQQLPGHHHHAETRDVREAQPGAARRWAR